MLRGWGEIRFRVKIEMECFGEEIGGGGRRGFPLTSAWCSWFCWRTSMTNSARRIVSSSFLAGVTKRPTFSEAEGWGGDEGVEWLVKHTEGWWKDIFGLLRRFCRLYIWSTQYRYNQCLHCNVVLTTPSNTSKMYNSFVCILGCKNVRQQ